MSRKRAITVRIDPDLALKLEGVLLARGTTLDVVVGLYLRAMVNSIDRGKCLGLDSKMPFGKYHGERVEEIARGDPGYLRFMLTCERPITLKPEVMELLQ